LVDDTRAKMLHSILEHTEFSWESDVLWIQTACCNK